MGQACVSENVKSLEWLTETPLLAAGVGFKSIRIFDLRTKLTPVSQISTKATRLLTKNPHNPNYFVAAQDSLNLIWDMRRLDEPVDSTLMKGSFVSGPTRNSPIVVFALQQVATL